MDEGEVAFDLFTDLEGNFLSVLIVFVMLFTLVLTVAYEIKKDMAFNSTIGKILGLIYVAFVLFATYVEFKRAFFS